MCNWSPTSYYPGTEEAHTNPTCQRGECLRALAGRRVSMCKDAKLSCRGNNTGKSQWPEIISPKCMWLVCSPMRAGTSTSRVETRASTTSLRGEDGSLRASPADTGQGPLSAAWKGRQADLRLQRGAVVAAPGHGFGLGVLPNWGIGGNAAAYRNTCPEGRSAHGPKAGIGACRRACVVES